MAKVKFDEEEILIAGHWLSAIINGDYTGLTDEEEKEVDLFISNFPSGTIFEPEEYPQFARDSISGMLGNVYLTKVYIPK